jgi:hypothetical protein
MPAPTLRRGDELLLTGKYNNRLSYELARVRRASIRRKIRNLVSWEPAAQLEPGCTAMVGMSSLMPDVLLGNLSCLNDNVWPELKYVHVVVDSTPGCLPDGLEEKVAAACDRFQVRFFYYNDQQARTTRAVRLPYIYSWLSWCIGIAACRTHTLLLHDYDALILNDVLARRYQAFLTSGSKIQGIQWYNVPANGISPDDRLATTFEAFVETAWLRTFPPIRLFNSFGRRGRRSLDYDTLLDIQHNETEIEDRTIAPMSQDDLVHPSQMVHQFTMFLRRPGADLPSFSIPMIPFFESLTVGPEALRRAASQIRKRSSRCFPFLRGDLLINFAKLKPADVDWCLKQMVQASSRKGLPPSRELHDYGRALHEMIGTSPERVWKGDFTDEQRDWIDRASRA